MRLDDPFYLETCIKCKQKLNIMLNAGTGLEATPVDILDGWMHMKCYDEMVNVINKWLGNEGN